MLSEKEAVLLTLYCELDIAMTSGKLEAAWQLLNILKPKCTTLSLQKNLLDHLYQQANIALDQNHSDFALQLISLAEEISLENKLNEWESRIHEIRGRTLFQQGFESAAFLDFQSAVSLALRQDQDELAADAFHGLGVVCHALDRNDEAEQFLIKAESMYSFQRRPKQQAYSLYMLGINALDTARAVEAILYQEKAFTLLLAVEDWQEIARNWSEQSMTLLHMGQYAMALEKNTQAIAIYKKQKMPTHAPLLIRSQILALSNKLEEALETIRTAEASYRQTGSTQLLPLYYHNRASILFHIDQFNESICALAKAIRIYKDQEQPAKEAYSRFLLAMILHLIGRTKAANIQWQLAGTQLIGQRQEYWQNASLLHQVIIASNHHEPSPIRRNLYTTIRTAAQTFGFTELDNLLSLEESKFH